MKVDLYHYGDENDKTTYMPLGIRYLKSYAEKYCRRMHEIIILEDLADMPEDLDIIGISCMSQDFHEIQELVKKIHKPGVDIILGGYHISTMPETLPEEVSIGVMYEGEETFKQLLDLRDKYGSFDSTFLKDIKGIIYWDNGVLKINEKRELIDPIEKIPFPDRQSVKPWWVRKQNIFSSRGCPFKCIFCASTRFWNKFREFSAQYVVDEIKSILNEFPNTREITFVDDLFTADKKRLSEIIRLMEKEGLSGKVLINTAIRADLVDDEMCMLLKEIHANFVYFGTESACPKILKYLKDNRQDVLRIQNALDLLKKYEIPISTTIILGTPGETEEDLRMTYDFIVENMQNEKLVEVAANILTPMPGTPIWDISIKEGILESPVDWRRLRHYGYIHTERFNLLPLKKWIELRKENRSFYLNTVMTEDRLYEIMEEYDLIIKQIFTRRIYTRFREEIDRVLSQVMTGSRYLVYKVNDVSYALANLLRWRGIKVLGIINDDNDISARLLGECDVISTEQAIPMLSSADGIIVCSHPMLSGVKNLLNQASDKGLPVYYALR